MMLVPQLKSVCQMLNLKATGRKEDLRKQLFLIRTGALGVAVTAVTGLPTTGMPEAAGYGGGGAGMQGGGGCGGGGGGGGGGSRHGDADGGGYGGGGEYGGGGGGYGGGAGAGGNHAAAAPAPTINAAGSAARREAAYGGGFHLDASDGDSDEDDDNANDPSDLVLCLTGKLQRLRSEIHTELQGHGVRVSETVTAATTHLVCTRRGTSKDIAARERGEACPSRVAAVLGSNSGY